MSGFRDRKRQMRRDLHREMGIPALYLVGGAAEPLPVTVRLHLRQSSIGDVPGLEVVQRRDVSPKILFMVDEVAVPKRGAIISVVAGEAYRIGEADEPDDISIAAHVSLLSAAEAAGLPVPA